MDRIGVLALAGLVLAACGPQRPAPMNAFEGRLTDWTREILRDSPELATQAGVSEDLAGGPYQMRLDDRSSLAIVARRGAALRRLVELRGLDAANLSPADALTYSVLTDQFEAAAAGAAFDYGEFSQLGGPRPYVLNQIDSAFLTLPAFLSERHGVRNNADAEAYLARLHEVAAVLDQETAHAREDAAKGVRPPLFIIDATLLLLGRVIATPPPTQPYVDDFRQKLEALAATESDAARKAELDRANLGLLARAEQIVRDQIVPALQRQAQFLLGERIHASDAAGVSNLPRGAEFYAAALRIETTTTLTPEEIHQIGLRRVALLTNQLDVALRRLGQTEGPVGQRLSLISVDPLYAYPASDEGRAQLLADAQARVARVMARAGEWFGRLPRAKIEVRRIPAFAEAGQPGAYYSPPSIEGGQPGIYYINLRAMSEMTRIDLPTQDFHEAVPGHHFQTALALEAADTPLLRRLINVNAYSEGWALYAEELADEQGLHEGDSIGRIGFLRWQLWRAARLVVDTGLHAKNWTRQQAIDYLRAATGDGYGVIATEVDRYVVWPGQACGYELGRREIMRLREKARGELGPAFDLRGFHDAVLLQGEVPLSVLSNLVESWIAEQRG